MGPAPPLRAFTTLLSGASKSFFGLRVYPRIYPPRARVFYDIIDVVDVQRTVLAEGPGRDAVCGEPSIEHGGGLRASASGSAASRPNTPRHGGVSTC